MQTFLPYPDFRKSAAVLDDTRLWKQALEARQILSAIFLPDYGWKRHPAVHMWRHYPGALHKYAAQIIFECLERGINAEYELTELNTFVVQHGILKRADYPEMPFWFGREDFHRAHQSNLVRKDYCYYRPKFPDVPNDLPYVWPHPLTNPNGSYQLKIRLFK